MLNKAMETSCIHLVETAQSTANLTSSQDLDELLAGLT